MALFRNKEIQITYESFRYNNQVSLQNNNRNNLTLNISLVLKFVNETVAVMERQADTLLKETRNEESVLQKLLCINRKIAILMAFDMIFAGVDNTTYSTSEFLYQLAINANKQAKLRDETFRLLPQIDSPITHDCLNNAVYLRACLKESMRVKPTISGHLRATGQDLIINGYQVPKTVCLCLIFILYSAKDTLFNILDQYKNGCVIIEGDLFY